jgi:hypothetical protein
VIYPAISQRINGQQDNPWERIGEETMMEEVEVCDDDDDDEQALAVGRGEERGNDSLVQSPLALGRSRMVCV